MISFRARPTVPRIEATAGHVRDSGHLRRVRQTSVSNRHRVARPLIGDRAQSLHLIGRVFFPFAAGYFLSYLFRTISALIAAPLSAEFALDPGSLGLLTSAYFLTFAAAQLPVGVLLDCYGPRRVQSVLLLFAAAGAALFAASGGVLSLLIGRALIGLGVAAALTAGLKATVLWFSKDRVPLVNGCMVMLGALGAVTATAPSEWLLGWIGWRGLFELFAIATAWSAGVVYLLVPEMSPPTMSSADHPFAGLRTIYTDPRFWRLAPLAATTIGTAWALQSLWTAPWLSDVDGLSRAAVVHYLLAMAVALSLGALLLGVAADRLRRCSAGPQSLFGVVTALFMMVQLALILRWPLSSYVLWCIVAAVGAATILSYAIVAEYYPKELAGRANGALNVFHIGGAFVVQDLTGVVIQHWPMQGSHYPIIAYQASFAINLALQVAAWIWFLWPSVCAAATDTLRRYLVVDLASP
jgi:MFS family permease